MYLMFMLFWILAYACNLRVGGKGKRFRDMKCTLHDLNWLGLNLGWSCSVLVILQTQIFNEYYLHPHVYWQIDKLTIMAKSTLLIITHFMYLVCFSSYECSLCLLLTLPTPS